MRPTKQSLRQHNHARARRVDVRSTVSAAQCLHGPLYALPAGCSAPHIHTVPDASSFSILLMPSGAVLVRYPVLSEDEEVCLHD